MRCMIVVQWIAVHFLKFVVTCYWDCFLKPLMGWCACQIAHQLMQPCGSTRKHRETLHSKNMGSKVGICKEHSQWWTKLSAIGNCIHKCSLIFLGFYPAFLSFFHRRLINWSAWHDSWTYFPHWIIGACLKTISWSWHSVKLGQGTMATGRPIQYRVCYQVVQCIQSEILAICFLVKPDGPLQPWEFKIMFCIDWTVAVEVQEPKVSKLFPLRFPNWWMTKVFLHHLGNDRGWREQTMSQSKRTIQCLVVDERIRPIWQLSLQVNAEWGHGKGAAFWYERASMVLHFQTSGTWQRQLAWSWDIKVKVQNTCTGYFFWLLIRWIAVHQFFFPFPFRELKPKSLPYAWVVLSSILTEFCHVLRTLAEARVSMW